VENLLQIHSIIAINNTIVFLVIVVGAVDLLISLFSVEISTRTRVVYLLISVRELVKLSTVDSKFQISELLTILIMLCTG